MRTSVLALSLTAALLLAACGSDDVPAPEPAGTSQDNTEVADDDSDGTVEDEPNEPTEATEPDESAVEQDETDEPDDEPTDEPATVDGQIVVNDVTYQVALANNCDPLEIGSSERSLELQARTPEGGQIDVYVDDLLGDNLSGAGDEGIFSSDDMGMDAPTSASITIDGDRVTGSGALLSALDFEDTANITFDLPITDTVQCR